ncbi:hypothetical protein CCMA1212_010328 [Trichoderma ghanense]|uniref:Uncharacterized protein n=1 Tax=Trichoderma ghanense TaxID=65468 RepID=A0ABY2GRN2_9HYPO
MCASIVRPTTCKKTHTLNRHTHQLVTTARHHHRSRSCSHSTLARSRLSHSGARSDHCDHCGDVPQTIPLLRSSSSPGSRKIPSIRSKSPHLIPRAKRPDEAVEPCALRLALPRWSALHISRHPLPLFSPPVRVFDPVVLARPIPVHRIILQINRALVTSNSSLSAHRLRQLSSALPHCLQAARYLQASMSRASDHGVPGI